jgi:hypothetical protein
MYPIYRYKDTSGVLHTVTGMGYNKQFGWWVDAEQYFVLDSSNGELIGVLHSTEEASVEHSDGTFRWFLDGIEYTKVQWLDKRKKT